MMVMAGQRSDRSLAVLPALQVLLILPMLPYRRLPLLPELTLVALALTEPDVR
ncbi:hypothetical protein [Paenibacillus thermotolerans]|uniref:hypothetical protein n=1 Tax=Paenibacillus thermotolerans TaxID=3027807 RepID=UPI0023682D51|nr:MULTISPECIES: hypothetical protein [unclassified Paenibacillus]